MIKKCDVMPLLLEACPGFVFAWRRYLKWLWMDAAPGIYQHTGQVATYLVEMQAADCTREFPSAFAAIERIVTEGDEEARDAATAGVLNSVHSQSRLQAFGPDVFLPWLGPRSLAAWREIEAAWVPGDLSRSLAGVIFADLLGLQSKARL